jgi:malonyl-CoA decarboxylase
MFVFKRRVGVRGKESTSVTAIELCRALLSERGEVSGARLAAQALAECEKFDAAALEEFFDVLARDFSPDPAAVWSAAEAYHRTASPPHLLALQSAVEPPRQELFRRLNMAPGGTAVLVGWRGRILQTLSDHPDRAGIDADLLHLFRSWFNRGFLDLRRIDWQTPAVILERLIEYEAVHQIQGWRDLRRRLQGDRRCYAFFHPALPNDPLIFIEVALTRGFPATVQALIDPDSPVGDPTQTDHAVFYSITNCQAGLRGVSFGNFLIKQVAEDLGREFPRIREFVTLSPIPGFHAWLRATLQQPRSLSAELQRLIDGSPGSPEFPTALAGVRKEMMQLAAQYLVRAKRADRAPADPTARFHLANGARLERVNWMGDTSPAGMQRSLGLTANYSYRLHEVEHNHEAYAKDYRVVISPTVARLVEPERPRGRKAKS